MISQTEAEKLLIYNIGDGVEAFSTLRDAKLPYPVTQAHQTHGLRIARIDRPGMTREELEGIDALVTDVLGIAIGARTADCIPVLLHDPVHKAIAAVHSGWRGTVGRISALAVERMSEEYGTSPSELKAIIGPGISADSFQVGPEVVEAFRAAGFEMDSIWSSRGPKEPGSMKGGDHIDLWEAVRQTLLDSGVHASNIQLAGIDTYTDERFYSARREGIACGRIINTIMISDSQILAQNA